MARRIVLVARRQLAHPEERIARVLLAAPLRLVEALPWLILNFPEMDWDLVIKTAKVSDAQNRLGFLIALAGEKAGKSNLPAKAQTFKDLLAKLEGSRLYGEDSFRRKTLTKTEASWLKKNRPPLAKHWRVLSDLTAEHT